jgi:hypothetical protein
MNPFLPPGVKVEVEWAPGGKEALRDAIAGLFERVPLTCGKCYWKFPAGNDPEVRCPNCGEDPVWDPPLCPLHEFWTEDAMLPDCQACDDLCDAWDQDLTRNNLEVPDGN